MLESTDARPFHSRQALLTESSKTATYRYELSMRKADGKLWLHGRRPVRVGTPVLAEPSETHATASEVRNADVTRMRLLSA